MNEFILRNLFAIALKRLRLPSLLFLAVAMLPLMSSAETENNEHARERKILIIDSYSSTNVLSQPFISSFETRIKSYDDAAKVDVVELGMLVSDQIFDDVIRRLIEKVKANKPELIVVFGYPAIKLLKESYLNELENIPVILCGYPFFLDFREERYPNVVMIKEDFNILANVKLGMKLFPDTKEIAIITDAGFLGSAINEFSQKQLKGFSAAKLFFYSGSQYTTDELMSALKDMDENSFIVYCGWSSYVPEVFFTPLSFLRMLREKANLPIFSPFGVFNEDLFGGIAASPEKDGILAAEIAERIFNGETLKDKVYQTEAVSFFNWEHLVHYGVALKELPPDSVFFKKPPSIWVQYKFEVLSVAFVFVVLALLVVFLVFRNRLLERNNIILQKLPLKVAAFNTDGKTVFNRKKSTGSTLAELAEMSHDKKAIFMDSIERAAKSDKDVVVEYDDGGIRNRAIFSKLPSNVFGKNIILAASMDVSDIYDARKKQQDIAEYLRITMESVGDGFIATDEKGVITMFNGKAESLTGIRRNNAIGRGLDEVYAPEKLGGHLVLTSISGEKYWISEENSSVSGTDGVIRGSVIVFRDITEAIKKQEEILAQNSFLNSAAELSNMIYFVYDENFNVTRHTTFRGQTFWQKRDGEYVPIDEWVAKDDVARFKEQWEAVRDKKSDKMDVTYMSNYEGQRKYYRMRVVCKPTSGEVEYFGIIQDVTESKETEAQLKDANILFETIMGNLPNMIFVKDIENDFRFIFCNASYAKTFHRKISDFIGKNSLEVFGKGDGEIFLAQDVSLANGAPTIDRLDYYDRPDFSAYMKLFKTLVSLPSGRRIIIGILTDITSEIDTRNELRNKNNLLSKIMDNIPCTLWVKNVSDGNKYVMVNSVYCNLMQKKADDMLGKTDFDFYAPEIAAGYQDEDRRIYELGSVKAFDEVRMRDGVEEHSHVIKIPIDIDGSKNVLGMDFDISDLVRARETLEAYAEHERIVNECLKLVVSSNSREAMAKGLVEIIGNRMSADMCGIFEFGEHFGVKRVFEWSSADRVLSRNILEEVSGSEITDWIDSLEEHKVIMTDNFYFDESPEFIQMRRIYESRGVDCSSIKSIICAGIWSGGKLWGFIALYFAKTIHSFIGSEERLFESAADIFGLYLDRQRGFEQLERSEAEKSTILESIQIPVMLFTHAGRLITANRAACKMLDQPLESMRGLVWTDICEDGGESELMIEKCVLENEPQNSEVKLRGREYMIFVSPIFGLDGTGSNVIISAIDMTEFNQGKRMLIKAMEAAKTADRAKSFFLATMSHELRTPLNAVIGYSDLAQDLNMSTEERIENVRNINLSAKVLMNLINDILDLSKLEAGQLELVPMPVSIKDLMEEIKHVFGFAVKTQGLYLNIDISPDLPNALMLDFMRLKQVLINIVGNAVKFTEKGGIDITATFEPYPSGKAGVLRISVKDSGIGMSSDFIPRIFEPFKQHPDSVRGSHVYQGTGLGMSISQRLVSRMGGRIDVESVKGEGSTFTVVLDNVHIAINASLQKPASVSGDKLGQFSGTVMIVDDVPMNLMVLEAILKKFHIKSISCASAKEALEKLKTSKPDAIFTDLWMPEMSGSDLAKVLRAAPETADLPIVIITADTQMDGLDRTIFNGILLKPITLDKINRILSVLGLAK